VRSLGSHVRRTTLIAIAVLAMTAQSAPAAVSGTPTEQEVAAALKELKADPNLATQKTVRTLHWSDSQRKPPKRSSDGWFGWLFELVRWIATGGRVLVWLAVGAFVALLVLLIVKLVRTVQPGAGQRRIDAPTHVRDLDIRPESLPDDIGSAALSLWRDGDHRGALSLLYRGLLSRLVHVHDLPIRDASTEGDCIELAHRHLAQPTGHFVARLVRMWQLSVYGAHEPDIAEVEAVCRNFDAALSAPASTSGTT
jgi:Domain of unknown function (DUF4129)